MSFNNLKNYSEQIKNYITDKKNRKLVIALVIGGAAIYKIIERIPARRIRRACKKIREEKESKHIELIEISPEKKKLILSFKAFEIAESIKNNKFTAEEVLYTYIERAERLGRKHNLTAEEPFEDAISRLSSLPQGPLSGVPISIKDEIFQENCHTSGGVYWTTLKSDPHDSILISLLRQAGAVPFIRGNAMQLMTWFETINNIYGRAENPWDPNRTTGGTSGGDAGLVAAGAAPLALGSDTAGSIRNPAAFCGVYGFKPSSLRTSSIECVSPHPTSLESLEIFIRPSYGALGRCVEDLVLVLKTWWQPQLWNSDNMVVPLKFNDEEYSSNRKLRIGFFDSNDAFESARVIKKIVRETCKKIADDGHEVIEMKSDMFQIATELFFRAVCAIEGKFLLEKLQGEDPAWPYMPEYIATKYHIPKSLMFTLLRLKGFKKVANYMSKTKVLSYKELCELANEIFNFKHDFDLYWQSLNLDVAVCPIWPLVAPFHETTPGLIHAFSYSFFWNFLDFPAGVVPVKLVEEGENKYEYFENDCSIKIAQENMENSVGLPVCIQVVAKTYQDEKVLRVMKIIQGYYKFHKYPVID